MAETADPPYYTDPELFEEMANAYTPPLYSDEEGEIDTSEACLVVIDGHKLREKRESLYQGLVNFLFDCSQKCALRLFTHPGEFGEGALTSIEGEELETTDDCRSCASIAIAEYNRHKDAKLKLEKLVKVNFAFWDTCLHYMTFYARDEDTGEVGLYQAALSMFDDDYVLGLFRDCCTEKTLAILSITGAEEDLEFRWKRLNFAKAGVRLRR